MALARRIVARYVGRVPYVKGLQIQQETADALRGGENEDAPDVLLLCQHDPVYTLGRRLQENDIDAQRLRALGADYVKTDRGGHITFHGPGQLVGYPILNLRRHKMSVKWYVGQIESAMIRACAHFGVESHTSPDTGVWVGNDKIGAIGVSVSRWITQHGFALNCDTDLAWFSRIVPCGLAGKGVTSLSVQTRKTVTVHDAMPAMVDAFGQAFERDVVFEDVSHMYEDTSKPPVWSPILPEIPGMSMRGA